MISNLRRCQAAVTNMLLAGTFLDLAVIIYLIYIVLGLKA
jgi:hypothetical protein